MMGTAQHPYDHDANDYTAAPDLTFELDSGGSFDEDDAMLRTTESRGTVDAQPKNKQHMTEARVMFGKINRFKVRTVSHGEDRLGCDLS
jgi:hypothetical protein